MVSLYWRISILGGGSFDSLHIYILGAIFHIHFMGKIDFTKFIHLGGPGIFTIGAGLLHKSGHQPSRVMTQISLDTSLPESCGE